MNEYNSLFTKSISNFESEVIENYPFPLLIADREDCLVFSNTAANEIIKLWEVKVGSKFPEDVVSLLREDLTSQFEVVLDKKTYLLQKHELIRNRLTCLYGIDITERLAIEKFPAQNPNPILKTDFKGRLIYANHAAAIIVKYWKIGIGELVPSSLILKRKNTQSAQVNIDCGDLSFSFNVVPVVELNCINIYGKDVSAVRALTKFPDQNPNPVLRCDMDGMLLYANPAAEFIRNKWKISDGELIPIDVLGLGENKSESEVEVGSKIYRFNIVPVPAFGFINIYGTDITASRDNEIILQKLAKYFSPQVYNSIFSGDLEVAITTKRKRLTVFFSDIKGFSKITEQLEPEDLTELITDYLTAMTDIAVKHGGTVDKYIGDAIMVFFGDPHSLGIKEDALACVRMAMEMKEKMYEIQKEWREKGISQPMDIRIGIHTDVCTVGNFGSHDRLDYTTIGNGVNLASRLESNASPNQILISEDTYLLVCKDVECNELGPISVKNISHSINTYEVKNEVNEVNQAIDVRDQDTGFSLYLDPNSIKNIKEKREILEKAMAILNKI